YMLLTNFLPNNGNGTVTLYAIATDVEGNETTLGQKTIVSDNDNAVKPFGAIDTPAQGATIWGDDYVNFGWALTAVPNTIPTDGSTITVWVDGVPVGQPVYNKYREDIAGAFPGYNNSNGPVGFFYLDTTAYKDGIHTIAWSVTDDAGNRDGIGSRYFTILNRTYNWSSQASQQKAPSNVIYNWNGTGITPDHLQNLASSSSGTSKTLDMTGPVRFSRGFNKKTGTGPQTLFPDSSGTFILYTRETEPVHIHLGDNFNVVNGGLKV
ncbi:MAG: hypothetical protein GY940_10250, partial [bacterium]|nr:hypothetical protein [bacterium]